MGIIRVQIPPRDPGPYRPGRRCEYPDCITVLRTTNPGPCCDVHEVTPFAASRVAELEQRSVA